MWKGNSKLQNFHLWCDFVCEMNYRISMDKDKGKGVFNK